MKMKSSLLSRGEVEFIEFPAEARAALLAGQDLDALIAQCAIRRFTKRNLVFNFPREQYSKLDRGETPGAINASWFTLSTDAYTDPSVTTVSGETLRVYQTTKVIDPSNSKASILRFILDVGQFVGSWNTALLIGGSDATSTTGTGKIIAAVNSVVDDLNQPLTRTGSTIHLVNWVLKHLDASEV